MPPEVVELDCGGDDCGAKIKVPAVWAKSIQEGKQEAPLCINCLGGTTAKGKTTVPMKSRQATARTETAAGKAPSHTTLIVRRICKGKRRERLSYVTELHPCAADKDMPESKLLMEFARAMADRARLMLAKSGTKVEGLGLSERLVKKATGGARILRRVVGMAIGKR